MNALRLLGTVPLLLAALDPTPTAQGLSGGSLSPRGVWTVNAAGGADFTDLPAAVANARPGDVLLVAPGDYTAFELCGKGLTILGDGGVPTVHGNSIVKQLAPGAVACLRSLELKHTETPVSVDGAALRLEDNAGTVWIEDSTIQRMLGLFNVTDEAAVEATGCAALVLARSQVIGSIAPTFPVHTQVLGAGLRATDSAVHAFESTFQGTSVTQSVQGGTVPHAGGHAVTLAASTLHASGCAFTGGQGQASRFLAGICTPAQPGGAGLHAAQASSAPVLQDCTLQGGPGGEDDDGCGGGAMGPASVGTIHVEPLPVFRYALETPVVAGTSYQLSAQGQPGDLVWSLFAEELAPSYVPLYFGTQVGALPLTLVFEGVADGTGALVKSVPVPPLTTLTGFERLFAQGLLFNATADAFLASPSVLVVVAPGSRTPPYLRAGAPIAR